MKKADLRKIARQFWNGTGLQAILPRDIEQAASMKLPISIIKLHSLKRDQLQEWFTARNFKVHLPNFDSELLGSLFAYRGTAFLFVNSNLTSAEQRFTVSHEIGHFLFDYHFRRMKAQKAFGTNALEILDGMRAPTLGERVDAVMLGVELKPYTHLFADSTCVSIGKNTVEHVEDRADFLADELIAPEEIIAERFTELETLGRPKAIRCIADDLDLPEYVVARQIPERPATGDFMADLRTSLKRSNK